jgi:hypothetical protein
MQVKNQNIINHELHEKSRKKTKTNCGGFHCRGQYHTPQEGVHAAGAKTNSHFYH